MQEFLEEDRENAWEAILSISITLIDEKESDVSQKVLFQKSYQSSRSCRERNPRALAEALSLAMSQISGKIIQDAYEVLANVSVVK